MQKYKLIKKYPSIPWDWKVGTIITKVDDFYIPLIVDNNVNLFPKKLPSHEVETPEDKEFWEEVVEKDYEIISFYFNDKLFSKNHPKSSELFIYWSQQDTWVRFTSNNCTIHSIKRLSDGEVFTVGDLCNPKGKYSNNVNNIRKIEFCREGGPLRIASNNWYLNVDSIEHTKKPLFTTEDGVDIYHNDYYYFTGGSKEVTKIRALQEHANFYITPSKNPKYKTFSTEKDAKEYIRKNTVLFTTEDGVDIYEGDEFWYIPKLSNRFHIMHVNKGNFRLFKYEPDKERYFSTKEKAEEYILWNKPCLSLKDVSKTSSHPSLQAKQLCKLVKERLNL